MNLFRFFLQKKILPDERGLKEIIRFVEERELPCLLPNLSGKSVLEIAPHELPLAELFRKKGARLITVLGGAKEREITSHPSFVVSHWEALPFGKETWDHAVVRLPFLKGEMGRLVSEVARILKPTGGMILSDLHPFSLAVQHEQREKRVKTTSFEEGTGFERYIRYFHGAGFHLESVREVFFDGTLKRFFFSGGEAKKEFETLKRSPLLIVFQLRKGVA